MARALNIRELPNGTGSFSSGNLTGVFWPSYTQGVFSNGDTPQNSANLTGITSGSNDRVALISLDLSKSSSIYGKTSKVQPKAYQALMIIKN